MLCRLLRLTHQWQRRPHCCKDARSKATWQAADLCIDADVTELIVLGRLSHLHHGEGSMVTQSWPLKDSRDQAAAIVQRTSDQLSVFSRTATHFRNSCETSVLLGWLKKFTGSDALFVCFYRGGACASQYLSLSMVHSWRA